LSRAAKQWMVVQKMRHRPISTLRACGRPTGTNRSHDFGEQRIKTRSKLGWGKDEFPGKWQLSTDEHRVQKRKQCIDTVGKAQSAERGALFWLRRKPPVTGAPVAKLIRRAIDVYLEQRKAEIKNA